MRPILLASIVLAAITSRADNLTVLNPGDSRQYLGVWCGGQTMNEFALGFSNQLNAETLVRVTTRCPGSGRGAKTRTHFSCTKVTFQQDGTILAKQAVNSGSYLQGAPTIPCAVAYDVDAIYQVENAELATGVINNVYRATVTTP